MKNIKRIFIQSLLILSVLTLNTACLERDFYLLGKSKMTIEVHSDYTEPGVIAKNNAQVSIESVLDTDVLGTYTITYTATIGSKTKQLSRTITVVDTTKPSIELIGIPSDFSCHFDHYKEEGFLVTDNYDLDIARKVMISRIEAGFKYSVTDSSGNSAEITRFFDKQDTQAPVITLRGSATIKMGINARYYEYGVTVSDNCDDVSETVVISNRIDATTLGNYTVTYTATDQSGNVGTLTRSVEVADLPITTVYLTFDDGPNTNTSDVLDILKEYDVKATFFIVYRGTKYNDLLKRVYDEGHTIGLHTYTHRYETIYSSTTAYFKDLQNISDYLYNVTGFRSQILRFPGGSSNSKSDFNPGIMKTLVKLVKQQGYHYFDWNVSTGDGNVATSAENILRNALKNIKIGKTSYVLLHDGPRHENTVEVLPEIMDYLMSINAVILPITMDTPEMHHNIGN